MLTRNRQGWRLLIVLSRLAVAGILAAGLTGLLRPDSLQAQSEPAKAPQPPPVVLPRPPDVTVDSPAPARNLTTPDSPPGPTPAESTNVGTATLKLLSLPPSLERMAARRSALNQVLCKDRRHRLLLMRGEQALSDGDLATALQNFQALTDASHDAFLWTDDSVSPRGARTSVDQALRSLSLEARQTYERLHGGEARAMQMEIDGADGTRSLLQLLQRFPHTTAGREVIEQELLRAIDAGQTALASQYAQRLARDRHHWNEVRPPIRDLVDRLLEGVGQSVEKPRHSSSSLPALRPRWVYSFTDGLRERSWDSGDPSISPADAAARVCDCVSAAADEWLSERHERRLPTATANQAVVIGNMLVVRDFCGVRAMQVGSGDFQWAYPCHDALANVAAEHLQAGSASPLSFEAHVSACGPRGRLTSDGQFVFFLEDVAEDPRVAGPEGHGETPAKVNRLVALPLNPPGAEVKPVWSHPARDNDELSGHCFLGPPLPVDGRLFVLSEFAMRLECIALDATDGRILWRQPIALAASPVACDATRVRIACTPHYAASTVVCPTEIGVLVGVDPLTGNLRWVYDHLDEDQRHSAGRWSSSTQRHFGSCELPSRTLVLEDRILHLPFRSESVHCVDAATGTPVWPAPAPRRGALGLSAVNDQNVVLIGQREVASLSPTDGSVRWTTPCPEPAGHGILAGDAYLLPLEDGRCLSLSLEDGTVQGARFGRLLHQLATPETAPTLSEVPGLQLVSYRPIQPQSGPCQEMPAGGNLSVAGDLIIATTPASVAVYPMAAPMLEELATATAGERLTEVQYLQMAMLQLLLEDRESARTGLQQLLATGHSPAIRSRAARLLRELLFAELDTSSNPRRVLDQLQQLPADAATELRLLVHRIDVAIQLGEAEALVTALSEMQAHSLDSVINHDGDASYQVNAYDDVADRLAQVRNADPDAHAGDVIRHIEQVVGRALQSGDVTQQRKVARLFDGWPQAASLQNQLAQRDMAAGRLQQAELRLLKNCRGLDREAAGRAHRLLVELYAAAGLQREAATHLIELDDKFRNTELGGGLHGVDFVRQSSGSVVWQIMTRRQEPAALARQARILEHLCGDGCGAAVECTSARALEYHDRIRRKFLTGDDASLTIIDRGIISADRSHSSLRLINRDSGQMQGEIDVPAAYWQLAECGEGYCGQLLPICGRSAHGVSLLERRSLWSSHGETESQRAKVKVGPIGNDYCVLQTARRLTVVDPATGILRWFRDDLSPDAGLLSNESTGVIGDSETLTIFDADQMSYTVYRMASGRLVRRGRLDISQDDVRRHRHAMGVRLVYVVSRGDEDRLRVWDANSDEILLDLPLYERLYTRIPDSQRYACITCEGKLTIADISAGAIELQAPLTAEQLDDVSELHVAAGPDHYLVNLVGCDTAESGDAVAAMDEMELPAMRVQGLLLAVSRDGDVEWSRSVLDAALLTSRDIRSPVLTLVSRVRDADHRQAVTLRVEILDTRSGETLAQRSDLLRTRFVQADYQHDRGRLTLIGLDSQIEIDFGAPRPEMLIHAEVNPSNERLSQ